MSAGFLYFIPGVKPEHVTPSLLTERRLHVPLRDLVERWETDKNCVLSYLSNGPGGKSGSVLIPNFAGTLTHHRYDQATQTWEDCEEFWLGYETDEKPTPHQLERPELVKGGISSLADGNLWKLPTIRLPINNPLNLECRFDRRKGQTTTVVHEKQRWAWELSGEIYSGIYDAGVDQCLDWAVSVLSLNYRVGEDEVSELGLLDKSSVMAILRTSIDLNGLEERLLSLQSGEKKTQEIANS